MVAMLIGSNLRHATFSIQESLQRKSLLPMPLRKSVDCVRCPQYIHRSHLVFQEIPTEAIHGLANMSCLPSPTGHVVIVQGLPCGAGLTK